MKASMTNQGRQMTIQLEKVGAESPAALLLKSLHTKLLELQKPFQLLINCK